MLFVALQDYNDHIAEISAKLVAIMDSLFEKVLSKVNDMNEIKEFCWCDIQT